MKVYTSYGQGGYELNDALVLQRFDIFLILDQIKFPLDVQYV